MTSMTVFAMLVILGTTGARAPPECVPWRQECYPLLYESETAAINVLFEPSSVVRDGIINLDCSAETDVKVQHCVDTDNLICSSPIMAAGLSAIRSYVCASPNKFLASTPCLNSDGFEYASAMCLNGEVQRGNNCTESRWNCVLTGLNTTEKCSSSDTELIAGLVNILSTLIPENLLLPCQ